jgi:peroxiredoxin
MTDEHVSNPKFGLMIGTIAPQFKKNDVLDNQINLAKILKENSGVILDFFRGAW